MAEEQKSFEDFTVEAIEKLRQPPWRGIHTTFSGFKDAALDYYGIDMKTFMLWLKDLTDRKIIEQHPSYRGVMIYLYGERPEKTREQKRGKSTLKKLGL